MAEKTIILRCQQGIDEFLWNFIEVQGAALLLAELTYKLTVTGVHPHGCLQFYIPQGLNVR